jgi:serine O-acetyltransferase
VNAHAQIPAEAAFDVDGLVAKLAELRSASQRRRYSGPTPSLPSRKTVVAIFDDLVAAIYPRHFGPQGLDLDGVNGFVGRTLRSALRALLGQIRLELALDDGATTDAVAMTEAFAAALPTLRALADSDARAGFEGDPSAISMDEVISSFPGFAAVLRHRLAHELYKLGAPLLARIAAEDAHGRTGVDIHPGAEIGERFFIDHGTGVVIGETTIIGRNVRLYQGVTLGAKKFETDEAGRLRKGYPRHPIVEDDVVVYAGATILGRVTIGRGSSIGGGVWLTQSVSAASNITQVPPRRDAFSNGAGI